MFPSEHGYAVVQAPVFETNVRPEGVGSLTITALAAAAPPLETLTVKTTWLGAAVNDGPVFVTATSAVGAGLITAVALAVLFPAFESAPELTVAVLVNEPLAVE